jgi:hypothetical protein
MASKRLRRKRNRENKKRAPFRFQPQEHIDHNLSQWEENDEVIMPPDLMSKELPLDVFQTPLALENPNLPAKVSQPPKIMSLEPGNQALAGIASSNNVNLFHQEVRFSCPSEVITPSQSISEERVGVQAKMANKFLYRKRNRENKKRAPFRFQPQEHNDHNLSQWEENDEVIMPPDLMSIELPLDVSQTPLALENPNLPVEVNQPPKLMSLELGNQALAGIASSNNVNLFHQEVRFSCPSEVITPSQSISEERVRVFEYVRGVTCPLCTGVCFTSDTALVNHWLTIHTGGVRLLACAYCNLEVPLDQAQNALRRHFKRVHLNEDRSRFYSVSKIKVRHTPLVPPKDWVLEPLLQQQLCARQSKTWMVVAYQPLKDAALHRDPRVGMKEPALPRWEWKRLWDSHPYPRSKRVASQPASSVSKFHSGT